MPNIILVIAEDVDVIPTATASYSARGSVDISIFTSTFITNQHLPSIWARLLYSTVGRISSLTYLLS